MRKEINFKVTFLSKQEVADLQTLADSPSASEEHRLLAKCALENHKSVTQVVELLKKMAAQGAFKIADF